MVLLVFVHVVAVVHPPEVCTGLCQIQHQLTGVLRRDVVTVAMELDAYRRAELRLAAVADLLAIAAELGTKTLPTSTRSESQAHRPAQSLRRFTLVALLQ